jgi:hypothetical protein
MSNLKTGANQFLEKEELNRLKEFIFDKSILSKQSASFGILKNDSLSVFDDFKVVAGSSANTIKIKSGLAIDSNLNLIKLDSDVDNLLIPNQTNKFWIFIRQRKEYREIGTVSVNTIGEVVGVGTKFTEVLRTQTSKFPTKIKFINSSNNQEYEISQIIDDNNLTLAVPSNVLVAESGLKYVVVGSFTPGYVVPSQDKDIYEYDSCQLNGLPTNSPDPYYVVETTTDVEPVKLESSDIYIARVWRGSSPNELIIEDKRNDIYKTQSSYSIAKIQSLNNFSLQKKLLGVESVKHLPFGDIRDRNEVLIGWGFRSKSYSVNSTLNKITFNAGSGGWFKSVTNLATNAFVGCRFYWNNGQYSKIISSTQVGSTHEIILEKLDMSNFVNASEVRVTPDADSIEIFYESLSGNAPITFPLTIPIPEKPNKNGSVEFPILDCSGKLLLSVEPWIKFEGSEAANTYTIKFRLKNNSAYSDYYQIEDSNIYYTEEAFDTNGNLVDNTKTRTINSSKVVLVKNPNSVSLGQKIGFETIILTNSNPIIYLNPLTVSDRVTINNNNQSLSDNLIFVLPSSNSLFLPRINFQVRMSTNFLDFDGKKVQFKLGSESGTIIAEFSEVQLAPFVIFDITMTREGSDYWIIDRLKPNYADTDWNNQLATLINGWSSTAEGLKVRRDNGRIWIEGSLTKVITASGLVAENFATLPVGFRPFSEINIPIALFGNGVGFIFTNLTIYSDGTMRYIANLTSFSSTQTTIYILTNYSNI